MPRVVLDNREYPFTDPPRRQRIRRQAAGLDRMSGLERLGQCGRGERLDADDLDAAGVPGGDPRDQPAAAHRHQNRIDIRCLRGKLEPERSLPHDGLVLIERRDRHGAGLPRPCLAGGQCIRIAVALDSEVGAIVADTRNLGRRGDAWNEDLGGLSEFHGGIGHRRAMISSRCRDHPGFRHVAAQEIGEGAARLEEKFELECEGMSGKTKLAAVNLDDRRSPDVGPNELLALRDRLLVHGIPRRVHGRSSAARRQLT